MGQVGSRPRGLQGKGGGWTGEQQVKFSTGQVGSTDKHSIDMG
jgi:hypothetical protein